MLKISKNAFFYLITVFSMLIVVAVLYLAIKGPVFPYLLFASWIGNLSAVIVLRLTCKKKGAVKRLFSRWLGFKASIQAYSLVFIYVLIIFACLIAYGILFEKIPALTPALLNNWLLTLPLLLFTGVTGEELGWRGYLLDEMQRENSFPVSSLFIGLCWALYHIPLWLIPEAGYSVLPYPVFFVTTIALSVSLSNIANASKGSLVPVTLAHFLQAASLALIPVLGLQAVPFYYLYSAFNVLYAVVILFAGWMKPLANNSTA